MAKAKQLPPGVPPESPAAPAGDAPPPAPVADAGGPLPRVIDQGERAPKGCTRYKIRAVNHLPRKVRYILAAEGDEEGARREYERAEGFDKVRELAKKNKVELAPLELVVTELPD